VDGEPSWFTVVAFRQLAEHLAESLRKGQRVIVDGQLRVSNWERDGKSGTNVEVIAADVAPSLLFGTATFTKAARQQEQEPAAEQELDGWNPGNLD
jgi:single-strand DNA-binding protein